MSKLISSNLKNIFFILLGNTIYALAVVMFILPSNLITGGTTGLALLFYNQFGLPINIFVSGFNIAMFGLGAFVPYMMTAYKAMGFDIADYPNAYHHYENLITLPLHTRLSDEDAAYVTEQFADIVKEYLR